MTSLRWLSLSAKALGITGALVCLVLVPGPALSAGSTQNITHKSSSVSVSQRNKLKKEQKNLEQKLGALKNELSKAEATRDQTTSALAESEAAISKVNRRLRELNGERETVEKQLRDLRNQERFVNGQLTDAEKQIRLIAKARYLNTQRQSWQSMLSGTNPHDIARDNALLSYLSNARERSANRLSDKKADINSVALQTRKKQRELANIAQNEQQAQAKLERVLDDKKQALSALQKQITSQKAKIDKLEIDQKRLGDVVQSIEKRLAEQAARQAALAKKHKQTSSSATRPSSYKPISGSFAKQRGRLVMPVLGNVIGRYGQRRANISGKSTTWKGMMILAKQGTDVLACAAGRVVFSDWLRGFGNIIIIDHGSGYLSIYANNESLFKSVGADVARGETIASVGNTGGEDRSGLYFELRHNGQPFNPQPWIGKQ